MLKLNIHHLLRADVDGSEVLAECGFKLTRMLPLVEGDLFGGDGEQLAELRQLFLDRIARFSTSQNALAR